MNKHTVVIVGRANVGKSTLFNKLISKPRALVSPIAGTTRDRLEAECSWQGLSYQLIDTGGFDINDKDLIEQQILLHTQRAIAGASLILLVVDAKAGLMPADREFVKYLKKANKPVIIVANKAHSNKDRDNVSEFYKLGFGQPWPISALSGTGTGDLLDEISKQLKKQKLRPSKKMAPARKPLSIMFVGQPNVGKSSLVNAILNEERVIVSPIAHTTRGVQTIDFEYKGQTFEILDSAGLRRSRNKANLIEQFSIDQIKNLLPGVDVVVLVTDVSERITVQDKKIIDLIEDYKNNLIIVANKWDLIPEKDEKTINKYVKYYNQNLPGSSFAPIVFTSASEKLRMRKILDLAVESYQERFRNITDNACDKFLKATIKKSLPKKSKGTKHPYLLSFKQVAVDPPTFELKTDAKSVLASAYIKYLIKQLRDKFGFLGTPIRIFLTKIDLSHKHRDNINIEEL